MQRRSGQTWRIAWLSSSVSDVGLLDPISVMENGERYLILDGCGRFDAIAEAGGTEAMCTVFELDGLSPREFAMQRNTMGRKVTTGLHLSQQGGFGCSTGAGSLKSVYVKPITQRRVLQRAWASRKTMLWQALTSSKHGMRLSTTMVMCWQRVRSIAR